MRVDLGLAVAISSFFFGRLALADVVNPPPTDCPAGSFGEVSHAGPYCRADDCSADATGCAAASPCQSQALCSVEIAGASMGGPFTVNNIVGPCAADGTCTEGVCKTLSVCMPTGGAGGAPSAASGGAASTSSTSSAAGTQSGNRNTSEGSGCSCHVPRSGSAAASALATFGLFAWTLSRRRRNDAR
jgi:hypothetical protein